MYNFEFGDSLCHEVMITIKKLPLLNSFNRNSPTNSLQISFKAVDSLGIFYHGRNMAEFTFHIDRFRWTKRQLQQKHGVHILILTACVTLQICNLFMPVQLCSILKSLHFSVSIKRNEIKCITLPVFGNQNDAKHSSNLA